MNFILANEVLLNRNNDTYRMGYIYTAWVLLVIGEIQILEYFNHD